MDKQSGELDRHMIQSLKSYLSKKILMAKQNQTNEKKIINQVACWRHKKIVKTHPDKSIWMD